MKITSLTVAAGAMGVALAALVATPAKAQIDTEVHVHVPYTTQVGDKTLPPGDYTIRQVDRSTDNNVLLIYGNNGMKFETSAMTIPAEKVNTPEHTRVVLGQLGNQYYFRRLWVAGANYGFEFPLPDSIKSREKEMREVAVNNQPTDQSQNSAAVTNPPQQPATHPENNTPKENANPPVQNPNPPAQDQSNQSAENNTQPASPSQAAPPVQEQTPPATPEQGNYNNGNTGSANRDANQDNNMPKTSAGWLMMLLSGGTLSGAGMMLRRKR